jgi:hypothetical protein
VSQVPANLLDAVARPDLRAKVFLAYLLPYLAVVWLCIAQFGIVGAGAAWALRAVAETTCFTIVAWRLIGFRLGDFVGAGFLRGMAVYGLLIVPSALSGIWLGDHLWLQVSVTIVCLAVFLVASWYWVLDATDKGALRQILERRTFQAKGAP